MLTYSPRYASTMNLLKIASSPILTTSPVRWQAGFLRRYNITNFIGRSTTYSETFCRRFLERIVCYQLKNTVFHNWRENESDYYPLLELAIRREFPDYVASKGGALRPNSNQQCSVHVAAALNKRK